MKIRLVNMIGALALTLAAVFALPGCDRKEKVLDIETPSGEIEVERDKDTGRVDVEVDGDDG